MKFKFPFSDTARDAFLRSMQRPRLVVTPEAVVTYTIAPADPLQIMKDLLQPETIDARIREVLAGNPGVNLYALQDVLGIAIVNIQRKSLGTSAQASDRVLISEDGGGTSVPNAARPMHIYMPGKTRFGKSTLLRAMALQDMEHGAGVCIMDAKGDLVKRIIHDIPQNRISDTIWLDTNTPVPIDFMSYDPKDNDEKEALIGELKYLLLKSVEPQHAPLMTGNITDLIYTLLNYNENPSTPPQSRATFLDLQKFFEDHKRQREILAGVTDVGLQKRWRDNFPTPTEASRITSRMTPFVRSSTLSAIFGATNPLLNVADAINNRKILLVNLGPIDEIKRTYGTLLISKIRQAIYRRANVPESERLPFYLYCDEFQEFQTSDFDKMLSLAGGFGLCLTLAHQFVDQLDERILQSVLGNVSTFILFRLGTKSANCLKGEISKDYVEMLPTLDRGEVIYRAADGTTKIVHTSPPPAQPAASSADLIRKRTLEKYACNVDAERFESKHDGPSADGAKTEEPRPSGRPKDVPPHRN